MAERFQHREARIREAVERGDLTPVEADILRQRLEMRRERLERWRDLQEKMRDAARANEGAVNSTAPPVPAPVN